MATWKAMKVKKEDKEEYEEMLQDFGWDMVWYEEIKEENPKRAEALLKSEQLEDKSWGMVEKIHDMKKGKERDAEVQKLRAVLAQIFVLRPSTNLNKKVECSLRSSLSLQLSQQLNSRSSIQIILQSPCTRSIPPL